MKASGETFPVGNADSRDTGPVPARSATLSCRRPLVSLQLSALVGLCVLTTSVSEILSLYCPLLSCRGSRFTQAQ